MNIVLSLAIATIILTSVHAYATSTNNGMGTMSVDQNPRQSITSPSTPTIPRPGSATTSSNSDIDQIPERRTINDSAPPRWDPAQGEVRDFNSNRTITSDPATTQSR